MTWDYGFTIIVQQMNTELFLGCAWTHTKHVNWSSYFCLIEENMDVSRIISAATDLYFKFLLLQLQFDAQNGWINCQIFVWFMK